ncbi:uncharacterized protein RCO7_05276 [Rhynchosporium graminicola]|uniref:Uncharacterized protein n=1 Tax=Rhynchosporium graminicola TaxID=2792576 RepID=A0A1E1LRV3_9HELO|nr:uncharacterized protein RCO7_05276 [Rhynchosporium commune]
MTWHSDLETGNELPARPIPAVLATGSQSDESKSDLFMRSRREAFHSPMRLQLLGRAEQFFEYIRETMGSNTSREYCLFICWENSFDDQRALLLLVDDIDDEMKIYQELVSLWYDRHGWWRKYIPFYKVQMVEEVEFSFEGKQEEDFSVVSKRLDIPKIKTRLVSELENVTADLLRIMDPDEHGTGNCEEEERSGIWDHKNVHCSMNEDFVNHASRCFFMDHRYLKRKLHRLELQYLPLRFFHKPEKAVTQGTLRGLAQGSCIYRTSELKSKGFFREAVAEAEFRALMIHTGFSTMRPLDVRTVAMAIVVLWKASGGTWEAAFASGGFWIMLFSLSPRTKVWSLKRTISSTFVSDSRMVDRFELAILTEQ